MTVITDIEMHDLVQILMKGEGVRKRWEGMVRGRRSTVRQQVEGTPCIVVHIRESWWAYVRAMACTEVAQGESADHSK